MVLGGTRQHVSGERYIMWCLMICIPHPNFSVNKKEKNKRAVHVACMGDWRVLYRVQWGNLSLMFHLGDPNVDGRILLRWNFRKLDVVL